MFTSQSKRWMLPTRSLSRDSGTSVFLYAVICFRQGVLFSP